MATDARGALLDVEGVTLRYEAEGKVVTATRDVSFQVFPSDRLILLGPSGCGKSTLLKGVGGFIKPSEGRILLGGRQVTSPGPDRMMVFQEFDQLLPWRTVRENIVFALTSTGRAKKAEARELADLALAKVKLLPFADAFPHTLSGGMKQRVAIARCLAVRPDIVLMDEPFAALDALTRQEMQNELLRLWEELRFTMLFVTHSIFEGVKLGNRIVMLSSHPGRVKAQIDVPPVEGAGGTGPLQERIREMLFSQTVEYTI